MLQDLDGRGVRSLLATFVALLLPVMLAVTTPTGAGQGVHAGQLLHPLFTHTHLVNGRVVSHDAVQLQGLPSRPFGVRVAAGTGLEPAGDGLVVSPALPSLEMPVAVGDEAHAALLEGRLVARLNEAPPDPPPT